ncbi:MAG: ATP synthase F1 subunit delta [Candidatus Sumerlaeia bacterium]|nr:ATP synthase F1 subunit delta [Candidatus Sumerlaeia bacterium]
MKTDATTINTYASSLLKVAERCGKIQIITQQVSLLLEILQKNPRFITFLEVPNIDPIEKKELTNRLLSNYFDRLLLNLVFILIDHRRAGALPKILERFIELEEKHRGFYPAEIYTAISLDEQQKHLLTQSLQDYTGYKLKITFKVDPRIIGGVIFRLEDTLIDASLKGQLEKLKSQLRQIRLA